MQIWVSERQARAIGCTHKARMHGIIPGFFSEGEGLWVSRSDLFNPIEDALTALWVFMREWRGEDPDFLFVVGRPI